MQGSRSRPARRKEKPLEGRKIINQFIFVSHKAIKPKVEFRSEPLPDQDTFKQILTRKHRESLSRQEQRPPRKPKDELRTTRKGQQGDHSVSVSRSKSKGLSRSKSLKQLGKKTKSMSRLQSKRQHHQRHLREERKSESPDHSKSIHLQEKKTHRSNYNSKTHREQFASEAATDRSRGRAKPAKPSTRKKPKKGREPTSSNKSRGKASKTVLISESCSKPRRTSCDWEGPTEDDFLHPRRDKSGRYKQHKEPVDKAKIRLSLTHNVARPDVLSKVKTEAHAEQEGPSRFQLENQAAVLIQKVYRGHLTRRFIRECFEENAALKIQRVWRGYAVRSKLRPSKMRQPPRILEEEEYLIPQNSMEQGQLLESSRRQNERWTSILEEILSEESVNESIKKRISSFLEVQKREASESEVRSASARSTLSSKVIHSELLSEKLFHEKERQKKMHPMLGSPKGASMVSPRRHFHSPQSHPKALLEDFSPAPGSAELLIDNLKNIQKFHRERLEVRAQGEKEELNQMLMRNRLSPRTHERRYRAVDVNLVSELERFNESINEIVKNCMLYQSSPERSADLLKASGELDDNSVLTPNKELQQLGQFGEGLRERSEELCEYYRSHKEELRKELTERAFDSGYGFIEEYLINLIDFVRQWEGGALIDPILSVLAKPRSLPAAEILRNTAAITEQSEEEDGESSFRLPLYKLMDLEEELLPAKVIASFNSSFPKLQANELGVTNAFQEGFTSMVVGCMNEALNSLRPTASLFSDTRLATHNAAAFLARVPAELEGGTEEEMQYQLACAQALSRIFNWNRQEWGRAAQPEQPPEVRRQALEQEDQAAKAALAMERWEFHEELVEIIGVLSQEVLEQVVWEEMAAFWTVTLDWADHLELAEEKMLYGVPPGMKWERDDHTNLYR